MTHDQTTPAPVEGTQLKPCPNPWGCDHRQQPVCTHMNFDGNSRLRYVFCHSCGLRGPVRETEAGAIAAWNTRHSAPAGEADTAAEVETMRQMREIAREMGYSDVLDALEALSDLRAPAGEVPCPHEAYTVDTAGQPVKCADCGGTMAAGEVEPVAWMYERNGDSFSVTTARFEASVIASLGWTETPLYTRPAPPADLVELVEALKRIANIFPGWPSERIKLVRDIARAALRAKDHPNG